MSTVARYVPLLSSKKVQEGSAKHLAHARLGKIAQITLPRYVAAAWAVGKVMLWVKVSNQLPPMQKDGVPPSCFSAFAYLMEQRRLHEPDQARPAASAPAAMYIPARSGSTPSLSGTEVAMSHTILQGVRTTPQLVHAPA